MFTVVLLLLALVVLGCGALLVIAKRVNAGILVGKSHLINPTDSPEYAKALGILIAEVASKPPVLRILGSERKVGRVWLEHRIRYESTRAGFDARPVFGPEILLVMTIEESFPFELLHIGSHEALRIDGKTPMFQWSSGLPGHVKAALRFEGEVPSAVRVTTEGGDVRIEIPGPSPTDGGRIKKGNPGSSWKV
jgi:hypothetical protein